MVKIPLDERTVYFAFKDVFKGPDAHIRKKKFITAKIREHQNHSEQIRALLKEHSIDNVSDLVKALLKDGVFASTLKAKILFPVLFNVSPAQSAERAASEAEAAKHEVDAIREVSVGQDMKIVSSTVDDEHAKLNGTEVVTRKEQVEEQTVETNKKTAELVPELVREARQPGTCTELSLYPVYLPARSQRRLLGKVQDILESACYAFSKRNMAQEMNGQGWDSPDCVELNIWMGIFKSKEDIFDAERVKALSQSFADLRSSIASIRHTAVHRLRTTAGKVESLLADAETFAALIADETCARQLSRLRRETSLVVEELGRNKDLLELRYLEKRKEIAARRAELDRIERMAWDTTCEEDEQYRSYAGMHLEEIINAPETTLHSAANSDGEETSEEDTSIESESGEDLCRIGEQKVAHAPLPSGSLAE